MTDIWTEITILLKKTVFGISAAEILFFFLFLLGVRILAEIFFGKIVQKWEKIAEKTETKWDDFITDFLKSIRFPTTVVTALIGARLFLPLSPLLHNIAEKAVLLVILLVGTSFVFRLIDFAADILARRFNAPNFPVLNKIAKIAVAGLSVVFALSNMGINVTGLVAGLGIGGIAIALAAQNVLRDLFASVSISLDRPFSVGDFVIVGDIVGTVTHIGIKSTRIKMLRGEEVSVPNARLTDADIHNFSTLEQRRVNFSIGVAYDTPVKKIRNAKTIIQNSIEAQKNTEFGRCFFWEFAESSLNFDIVYFVKSADYDEYLTIQEAIGLDILEKFEKEKIEIAFPTRTVWMKK